MESYKDDLNIEYTNNMKQKFVNNYYIYIIQGRKDNC